MYFEKVKKIETAISIQMNGNLKIILGERV